MQIFTSFLFFSLSSIFISATGFPIPFQNIQTFPMTSGNSLLSPFVKASSGSPLTSPITSEITSHLITDDVFHTAHYSDHASAPLTSLPVDFTTSTTSNIASNTVERFNPFPSKGMTPMFTYFFPTHKCPANYLCRAQMTIYEEFTGATAMEFGYSIWNFKNADAAVPKETIAAILATTNQELYKYIALLAKALFEHYPNRAKICYAGFRESIPVFRKVIEEMESCTQLSLGFCGKKELLKRCSKTRAL